MSVQNVETNGALKLQITDSNAPAQMSPINEEADTVGNNMKIDPYDWHVNEHEKIAARAITVHLCMHGFTTKKTFITEYGANWAGNTIVQFYDIRKTRLTFLCENIIFIECGSMPPWSKHE